MEVKQGLSYFCQMQALLFPINFKIIFLEFSNFTCFSGVICDTIGLLLPERMFWRWAEKIRLRGRSDKTLQNIPP